MKANLCGKVEFASVVWTQDTTKTVALLDPRGTMASQTRVSNLATYGGMTVTTTGSENRIVGLDEAGAVGEGLARVARTVGGVLDVDYESTNGEKAFRYFDSDVVRLSTVALTIDAEADLDGGNSIPFARGTEGSPTRVSVTWPGGTVTVVGDESYQRTEASLGSVAANKSDAQILAEAVLAQPRALRLMSASIDLVSSSNDLYANAFALDVGDRLRVTGLPSALLGVSYVDAYVQGWTEEYDTDSVVWQLDTSPADVPTEGMFDASIDPGLGRFSAGGAFTVTGGTALGTTGTGTIVITTSTSGLFFTTVSGCYPIDLDWNGERVTVTAAPSAGAGTTQTLTLTARGVAPSVARVHASGETIDVWHSAGFTY